MKLFSLVLAVLVLSSVVQAASLYKEDFSNINQQTFTLKEKDTVRIFYLGKETEVMLRSVDAQKNSLKLTLFIEGAETPQYVTLKQGINIMFDVDKDRIKDLIIRPIYISKENSVISIEKISIENQPAGPTGEAISIPKVESSEPKTNLKVGLYISLGIIIIGLTTFLIFRKKKNQ
ncbi:MAG TPA: LPXTG cell wall anchor domain-containing protein [Candidatus Nanoarchaeia archaeon]|nr:LPXTG cell wall anchor domain-containing protein [Candidatus Nanoarchaeia archaeon]